MAGPRGTFITGGAATDKVHRPGVVAPSGWTAPQYVSDSDLNDLKDHTSGHFNLRSYGGVCDGATSDNAAMTLALAAIGSTKATLDVPGSCYVPGSFTIPTNVVVRFLGLQGFAPGSNVTWAAGTPTSLKRIPADLEVHHLVRPIQPAPQSPTLYPAGNDLLLQTQGPADLWLSNAPVDVTSTTTVGAPGTVLITVNSTAMLAPPSGGQSIAVEPLGANFETIVAANWTIVDATHISATFTKTHAQPFTIRQMASTVLGTNTLVVMGAASVAGSGIKPLTVTDANIFPVLTLPSNDTATWPLGGIALNGILTGDRRGSPGMMLFRHHDSGSVWTFYNAAQSVALLTLDNAGLLTLTGTLTLIGTGTTARGEIPGIGRSVPAYGTAVAISTTNMSFFDIVPTDGVGFTISTPTGTSYNGQEITVRVKNTFGVLGAITWGAAYKTAGWVNPANGFSRTVRFVNSAGLWIQIGAVSPDLPN